MGADYMALVFYSALQQMLLDHQGAPDLSNMRPQSEEAEQVNATTENIIENQIILSNSKV